MGDGQARSLVPPSNFPQARSSPKLFPADRRPSPPPLAKPRQSEFAPKTNVNRRFSRGRRPERVRQYPLVVGAAPSVGVLALLAALVADQARAIVVPASASAPPTSRDPVKSGKSQDYDGSDDSSLACPDVPDFLCPALLAKASATPVSSAPPASIDPGQSHNQVRLENDSPSGSEEEDHDVDNTNDNNEATACFLRAEEETQEGKTAFSSSVVRSSCSSRIVSTGGSSSSLARTSFSDPVSFTASPSSILSLSVPSLDSNSPTRTLLTHAHGLPSFHTHTSAEDQNALSLSGTGASDNNNNNDNEEEVNGTPVGRSGSATNYSPQARDSNNVTLTFTNKNDDKTNVRKRTSSPSASSRLSTKRRLRRAEEDEGSTLSTSTSSTECSELYTSRTIPDRYELGNDGRWHKLSVSSSCSQCQCTSHEVDDEANNEISPTGVTNDSLSAEDLSSITASPSSGNEGIQIVLPDGWERSSSSAIYKVPLIVITSLLVAAAVTGAVWFSFFWRRRQRTAKRLALARDLEKRRKAEGVEESGDEESGYEDEDNDDQDGNARGGTGGGRTIGRRSGEDAGARRDREKTSENRTKARWARAAAMWKAHVRWIHRRKRGRAGIVDGIKHTREQQQQQQQQDDVTASGVSLSRSSLSLSSRSSGRQSSVDNRRSRSRLQSSSDATERGSRTMMPSTSASASDSTSTLPSSMNVGVTPSQPGSQSLAVPTPVFRARATRNEGRLPHTHAGLSSVPRRSINVTSGPSSVQEQMHPLGSNLDNLDLDVHSSVPLQRTWSRSEYDRPPPDIGSELQDGIEAQGPPAYRSRQSADSTTMRALVVRSRRRRRDEKSAAVANGSGYVPAPEDYAPYSSSEEDEDGASERRSVDGGTSRRRRRRSVGEEEQPIQMHVAVDDKRALERLATYASAPPPPPSSPPPPSLPALDPSEIVQLASSHPAHLAREPNAPPEPEWEHFGAENVEGYGMVLDSPGAGPGPSTVYARSISSARCSLSGPPSPSPCDPSPPVRTATARSSTSPHRRRRPPSPSPSPSPFPFPAPPKPITSQIAYAPADAGLTLPDTHEHPYLLPFSSVQSSSPSQPPQLHEYTDSGRGYGYGYGYGYGPDDFDVRLVEGPSAPPFEAFEALDHDAYYGDDTRLGDGEGEGEGGEGTRGVIPVAIASAPPLFLDEDEGQEGEGEREGRGPSAPLEINEGDRRDDHEDVRDAHNAEPSSASASVS